ncbi:MAG TPA: hypothetical protein DDY31_19515 [Lachnospiraceae bacterium]|nr:hypothetical protein [Lachnospiraceae bacterium]
MESVTKILISDKMIIIYELIGIIAFGGLDIFFGKKKKTAKLEEERAAAELQENQLKESLSNTRRR